MAVLKADIAAIQSIKSIPTILEAVSELTGLRFTGVARVDQDSWTACAVLDRLDYGLKAGDQLDIETTLCHDVRETRLPVVIDEASTDPVYCTHPTPRRYRFESYISVPLYRPNGEYFGSLFGIDSVPHRLKDSKALSIMTLFAELISKQLETESRLHESAAALLDERQAGELREQFIGILGHDLRTPLQSILLGVETLLKLPLHPKALEVTERIQKSGQRISAIVDDLLDLTRGKMGHGIVLDLKECTTLKTDLEHAISELQAGYPDRAIIADLNVPDKLYCDSGRVIQLCSNLLANALLYGARDKPVRITASHANGVFLLSVANEGRPIPEAELSRLFHPYWRGETSSAQGLGLGLYIASEIAKSHHGTLDVISNAQETRFTFTLPLRG